MEQALVKRLLEQALQALEQPWRARPGRGGANLPAALQRQRGALLRRPARQSDGVCVREVHARMHLPFALTFAKYVIHRSSELGNN